RTFDGKTITETLGAIIHKEPDWDGLPATTPWRIQELLRRCLTKDAHDRLRDIATVRIEVKLALYEPATVLPIGVGSVVQPQLWRRAIPWSIALVAVIIAVSIAFWSSPQPISPPSTRFAITPSLAAPLASVVGNNIAISPDGRQVVYRTNTQSQLYLHSLDDFVDRPIPGTEGSTLGSPFFSPDGKSVGFFAGFELKKVSLAGGLPITLCDARPLGQSGSWGADDTIIFSAAYESGVCLYRVSGAGAEPEILAAPDLDKGETEYSYPHILPGGKAVLFTIAFGSGDSYQVAALSLETGEQKVLIEDGKQVKYVETGHLIYAQSVTGNLMAVSFDLATLEVTSAPVLVLQGVRQNQGAVDYALSEEGTLIYVPGTGGANTLVWVDREGPEEPLAAEPRGYNNPRISPDGLRLAVTVIESGVGDVWIYDLKREIPTRLTFDPAVDHWPIWTPDSQRVVFDSTREGANHNLFWKAADGTGQVERLTTSPVPQGAYSFSPDGTRLVIGQFGESWDVHVLSMEGEFTSQPLLQSEFDERRAVISPDGRWIAYDSDESGRYEVYVRPFPNVEEGKWQISRDGGTEAVWAPRGQELFFRNGRAMMVVGIKTEPTFTAGSPVVLFTGRYRTTVTGVNYDISPDGQRFLMIKAAEEEEGQQAQINVVLNWFEELKRLVPTP
ncbi:MAG: hypothetical protein V3T61_09890, partial [Acidobacteriota bacterium]